MGSVTIPRTHVFQVESAHAEAPYQLWVAEPVAGVRPLPPGPRPVLWVLDANLFFGTAVEATRIMHQLFGELPPLLVVGVAYDTEDPVLQAELRARDFTPSADAGFASMTAQLPGSRPPTLPADRRLGRADEFLEFLVHEAAPLIESHYDVLPGQHILFGSSLGGLFVLHAFLAGTAHIGHYVSVSPGIWWDDGLVLRRLATAARPGRGAQTLFLAVGGDEERADIPMLASFKMVSNVESFASALQAKSPTDLRVAARILEGESHTSVVPVGLTRGLRFVFRP